jgi:hypothetical protein
MAFIGERKHDPIQIITANRLGSRAGGGFLQLQ